LFTSLQGETFEKRNVKVGVTDYFYAEIQEGLSKAKFVTLEMPKEERERKFSKMATSAQCKARRKPKWRAYHSWR